MRKKKSIEHGRFMPSARMNHNVEDEWKKGFKELEAKKEVRN